MTDPGNEQNLVTWQGTPKFPVAPPVSKARFILLTVWLVLFSVTVWSILNIDRLLLNRGPSIAKLHTLNGLVESHPDQLTLWNRAAKGQLFYELDSVATGADASAKIKLVNNATLVMNENSQIKITLQTNSSGGSDFVIKLFMGSLEVRGLDPENPLQKNSSVLIEIGGRAHKVTAQSELQIFQVRETGKRLAAVNLNKPIAIDVSSRLPIIDFSKGIYLAANKPQQLRLDRNFQQLLRPRLPTPIVENAISPPPPPTIASPTALPTIALNPLPKITPTPTLRPTLAMIVPKPPDKNLDPQLLPILPFTKKKILWSYPSFRDKAQLNSLRIPLALPAKDKHQGWLPRLRLASLQAPREPLEISGQVKGAKAFVTIPGGELYTFLQPQQTGNSNIVFQISPGYLYRSDGETKNFFSSPAAEVQLQSLADFAQHGMEILLPDVNSREGFQWSSWFEQKAELKTAPIRVYIYKKQSLEGLQPVLANGSFGFNKSAPPPTGKGSYVIKDVRAVAKISGQFSEQDERELIVLLDADLIIHGEEADIIKLSGTAAEREAVLLNMISKHDSTNVLINGTVVKIDQIIITKKKALFKSLAQKAQGYIASGVSFIQP